MKVLLVRQTIHLTNALILTKDLLRNVRPSLQGVKLDLLDILPGGSTDTLIIRHLRPCVLIASAKRAHDLPNVRHDRVALFGLDLSACD